MGPEDLSNRHWNWYIKVIWFVYLVICLCQVKCRKGQNPFQVREYNKIILVYYPSMIQGTIHQVAKEDCEIFGMNYNPEFE